MQQIVKALSTNSVPRAWSTTIIPLSLTFPKYLKLLLSRRRLLNQMIVSKSLIWNLKVFYNPHEFFIKLSGFLPQSLNFSPDR